MPMNNYPPLEIKVWGDFACFTRPDMKVERVSYSVMTPSAARGVLEAVFWKPEFQWRIREIHILREIKHFSILRNEVNSKVSVSSAKGGKRYFADGDRAQRHSLVLRDVEYIIKADIAVKDHSQDDAAKYRDQFRRRVSRGQCYHTPYLGCREFSAFFSEPEGNETPIDYGSDLGLMLFDLQYQKDGKGAVPVFFRANVHNGIMKVPQKLYEEGGNDG